MKLLLKGIMMFDETNLPQPSPGKREMTSLLNLVSESLILKGSCGKRKMYFATAFQDEALSRGVFS
jgi:hypothetical protein